MAIDHAGLILFPSNSLLRVIGRFAMPMYAYGIAKGYYFSVKHHTLQKYKRNLMILAIVSQVPFFFTVEKIELNICVTWLFAIYLLDFILSKKYINAYCLLIIYTLLQSFIKTDYGILGLILPMGIYFFESESFENENKSLSLMLYPYTLLASFMYCFIDGNINSIQYYCILYIPILNFALSQKFNKVYIPKWLNYSFYPLSMIPFLLIKLFI